MIEKKRLGLRGMFLALGLAGVSIFLFPVFTKGIKNIGSLTGAALGLCLMLYAVFFHSVNRKCKEWLSKKTGKIIGGIFLTGIACAVCAGLSEQSVWCGRRKKRRQMKP